MENITYQKNKFRASISNWKDVKIETAKFWYDEAEKHLKETQSIITSLNERAYKIMNFSSICAASMFSFIAFFIKGDGNSSFLIVPTVATIILYGIVFLLCFTATKQGHIVRLGIPPEKSMDQNFIQCNDDKQTLKIILSATESCQDGITANHNIINKKSESVQRMFIFFLVNPFIIASTLLFTTYPYWHPLLLRLLD